MATQLDGGDAQRRARIRLAIIAVLILASGAILWRFTPIAQWATPTHLLEIIDTGGSARWAPLLIIVSFIVGGLVFFPVTVLIAVSALMFEPLLAFVTALTGTLANATVTYAVGARWLRSTATDALGGVIDKLDRMLEHSGIIAIAVIRNIPLAPFTAVNLAAGMLRIRFRDYTLGTALGAVPGITAFTLFGQQLQAVLKNPTPATVLGLIAIILGWIALSLALQKLAIRWHNRQ